MDLQVRTTPLPEKAPNFVSSGISVLSNLDPLELCFVVRERPSRSCFEATLTWVDRESEMLV